MTDNTQPEAVADCIFRLRGLRHVDRHEVARAMESMVARIAELEAQLEAIGAGGVSGPLMGQPQAMPDLSALTERGAKAWAGVDAQGLREGVASAGSEPVATIKSWTNGSYWRNYKVEWHRNDLPEGAQLYTHPSPPEGMAVTDAMIDAGKKMLHNSNGRGAREKVERIFNAMVSAAPPTAQAEGWTKLPGQLPEPGMPVLLDIGKKYPIRAMWAAKHTVQAADDDTDWGEYVEEDDMYYAPEGWYEWNQCEDNHWRVTETPRAWMPLPPTSAEGVEHG